MTEIERHFRAKVSRWERLSSGALKVEEVLKEVKDCPDYFVMEGGADGTFAHEEFLDKYGGLMPEIVQFASECGGKV